METPISSRRRRPRWCLEGRRLNTSDGTSPSTPSNGISRGPLSYDDSEDEPFMPSTQMFHDNEREVFWDYEASPQTRANLNKHIEKINRGEKKKTIKNTSKPPTPSIKLRSSKSNLPGLDDLHTDKDFLLLQQLGEKIGHEESVENLPKKSSENLNFEEASDPFDQDDSFLVQCSQAIEDQAQSDSAMSTSSKSIDSNSNHTFKLPQVTVKGNQKFVKSFDESKPEKKKSQNDSLSSVFESEDSEEFELLLSQVDLPEDNLQPVLTVPSPNASFKRFKSADDALKLPVNASSTVSRVATSTRSTSRSSTSFRRISSSPDVPPGPLPGGKQNRCPVKPKCSKDEIERKRQEAIRKRLMNSQKKGVYLS